MKTLQDTRTIRGTNPSSAASFPSVEDYADHFRLEENSRLLALTHAAAYMIDKINLNRPQLVKLRQERKQLEDEYQAIVQSIDTKLETIAAVLRRISEAFLIHRLELARNRLEREKAELQAEWEQQFIPRYEPEDFSRSRT